MSVGYWVIAGLVAAGTVGDPRPSAGQSVGARGVYVDGAGIGVKFQVLRERGGDLKRVSSTSRFSRATGSSWRWRRIARRSSMC